MDQLKQKELNAIDYEKSALIEEALGVGWRNYIFIDT
jgi:hypothetical protein